MIRTRRLYALVVALLALLVTFSAAAQPVPGQPPPPPQRPLPPGMRPPARPNPAGQPRPIMPGERLPAGHPPIPGHGAPAKHEEHAPSHGEHCPGHGPLDPPGHINFAHGILGVDNEKAPPAGTSSWKPSLWRYENKEDACDARNEPPPLLANFVNFGVLCFIIVKFGKKPIHEALRKRRESIMHEIDTATQLKRDAKARLGDYRVKFERIEETLEELKAEYAAQSQAEKTRILAEAQERRARMRRDAQFRIEQELKAARQALLNEAVDSAVAAAEQLIRQRVEAQDQDRINDQYLAVLSRVAKEETSMPGGAR